MLLITGTVKLPASRMDTARPIMAAMVEASRAEAGCLEYAYSEDVLEPGLIHINERWTDRAALSEHARTPHLATWRAKGASLGIGDRNLRLYEVGESEPI